MVIVLRQRGHTDTCEGRNGAEHSCDRAADDGDQDAPPGAPPLVADASICCCLVALVPTAALRAAAAAGTRRSVPRIRGTLVAWQLMYVIPRASAT